MTAVPPTGRMLFGAITLAPGVTAGQVWTFVAVLLCSVFAIPYVMLMQPLILTDLLRLPSAHQGVLLGALNTAQQAAFLLCIGFAGTLSDLIGRRLMLAAGLAGFALCMWAYPFIGGIAALFAARIAWGVADSALSIGRVARFMDYPANESRGKFISLMMLLQSGLAALFVALVASRLPSWLRALGLSGPDAIRSGFLIMSLVAVLGAGLAFFRLAKDPRPAKPVAAPSSAKPARPRAMFRAFREVFAHARTNPRLAAVLLIGTIIRTDSAVFTAFLGLWVIQSARTHGVDPIEAVKTTGLLMLINGASGFVTPPIFGWLADRMDRLTLLIGSMIITGVAFCCFGLIRDVFSPWIYPVIVLVGLAVGAHTVAANALLGEETPEHIRGSVIGVFTFLGTASVLVMSVFAGYLFDKVGAATPFVFEGLLCFAVSIAVVILLNVQTKARDAKVDAVRPDLP